MHSVAWWPTLFVLAVATFTDLRSRRIPNWLVLPFMLAGFLVSGWLHGWHGIVQSLSGLVLGTVLFGFLCLMGGMGMGDVKLCASIGAWIGPGQLVTALVLTGIAGGITGELVFGFKDRGFRPHPELVLDNPLARKMPYAPAIAIGTLVSFFSR
jgi:prepilin peptidase CpaA